MKYASVCSGVEAASLAWIPLGWEAAWFSEIEPFPCAVLQERFPNVPNLGDMTKITVENLENGDQKFIGADGAVVIVQGGVDLLVGGTPCQSFSVAGKREGLEGASGLAEHFVRLLREMRPRWFVWENVPGALSSRTRGQFDFNFLVREYAKCGYACGWRVLDAQYVRVDGYPRAVPQRRRRVFVVGHSSADWRYPASVLFEPDCLFGNTPPRRIKGKVVAGDAEDRAGTASVIRCAHETGQGFWQSGDIDGTLRAEGENRPSRPSNIVCNAGSFMGGQGAKAGGIGYADEIAQTIKASPSGGNQVPDVVCVHGSQDPICNREHANSVNRNNGLENCVCYGIGNGQPGEVRTGAQEELDYTHNATGVIGVSANATVRRLLPVECERLMGFPDNWTRIPWKGKPEEECPDSPRYKACGNSMCVNVMRWIGMRIELVERKSK